LSEDLKALIEGELWKKEAKVVAKKE